MNATLTVPALYSILTVYVSAKDERAMREAALSQGLDVLTFIQNAIARAVLEAQPNKEGEG